MWIPDPKTSAAVVANFRQIAKSGTLKLHPLVTRLLDPEVLEKMGAKPVGDGVANSRQTSDT